MPPALTGKKPLSQLLNEAIESLSEKAQIVLIYMYGLGEKPREEIYKISDRIGGHKANTIIKIHDLAIKALRESSSEELQKYVAD